MELPASVDIIEQRPSPGQRRREQGYNRRVRPSPALGVLLPASPHVIVFTDDFGT